jgi:hypothetical protein
MDKKKKVAIIGSGISGLSAAYFLQDKVDISLFEKNDYFGGHANTVDVELVGKNSELIKFGVDTGFLVFNEKTYPGIIKTFNDLNVVTAPSDMSFSVQADVPWLNTKLEWSGSSLNSVFAQRRNLFSACFWKMLKEIVRFNKITTEYAKASINLDRHVDDDLSLSDYLKKYKFGEVFQHGYLLPMLGCIWSCEPETMLKYPAKSLARFCNNHGLLQVTNRPQWFTVQGGSRQYVKKITDQISDKRLNCEVLKIERVHLSSGLKIIVHTEQTSEDFDAIVLGVHAPQILKILDAPSSDEQKILSNIKTQENIAVLHCDESIMPSKKIAWAAWNFEKLSNTGLSDSHGVCLHYWINKLQPLPFEENVFVTLNPQRQIKENKILKKIQYAHPILDKSAVKAQEELRRINGGNLTWYAGAWMGNGFHEDGLQAGKLSAQEILKELNLKALN